MKKIIAIISVAAIVVSFAGCNKSWGFGNYSFKHIHFSDAVNGYCGTVEKWYDNQEGIEVKTKEYGPLFLSEGTYTLVGEKTNCPYCKGE